MNTNFIQHNYNSFQLVLPIEIGLIIPKDSLVRTFDYLFHQINVEIIVEKSVAKFGRPTLNQVVLLKLVLDGFMTGIRTSREISKACIREYKFYVSAR